MNNAELLLEYTQSCFDLMNTEYPINTNGHLDVPRAMSVCAQWSALGKVASPRQWKEIMYPEIGWQVDWNLQPWQ